MQNIVNLIEQYNYVCKINHNQMLYYLARCIVIGQLQQFLGIYSSLKYFVIFSFYVYGHTYDLFTNDFQNYVLSCFYFRISTKNP